MTVQRQLALILAATSLFAVVSAMGLMQVSKGARFHQLNSLHLRHVIELRDLLAAHSGRLPPKKDVERVIDDIRSQPVECLASIRPWDRWAMRALGTDVAIRLCEQDAALADQVLADLAACIADEIEVEVMLGRLREATQRFHENSARFEEPIGRTVEVANRVSVAAVLLLAAIVIAVTLALFRRIHRLLLARDEATEALFESERRHWLLAHHDALTGLPNRILLRDRLEGAIARADRKGWLVGLAFIDLDHFKLVNDTWGHAAGDHLIRLVAARIRSVVRKTDTIARYGGDEFVVVLEMAPDRAGLMSAATKILEVLAAPFSIEGTRCRVSASLGLAIYPEHAGDGAELLRKADFAMYGAKAKGRNRIQLHHGAGLPGPGTRRRDGPIPRSDRDAVAFDEA